MAHPEGTGRQSVQQWWFAALLAILLLSTAVAATPQGYSLIDNAVSVAGSYYQYLAAVFKQ
ncbi:MAG TPA: hypothetical protein VFU22_33405 [Roseiflexaceae bacterium]|nr:hypothetical protein [Roseiflexaceae bacterium]